jgi:hypothetical protein
LILPNEHVNTILNALEVSKYHKWYDSIIERRRANTPEGYVERHHIIPHCLGGSNDNSNIVKLTAREHFVCHLLLTKMFPDDINKTSKMVVAWCWMAYNQNGERDYKVNSRLFETRKIFCSKFLSKIQTENNSQRDTKWIYNLELRVNKKIAINELLPEGWTFGRVLDWEKKFAEIEKKTVKHISIHNPHLRVSKKVPFYQEIPEDWKIGRLPRQRKAKQETIKEKRVIPCKNCGNLVISDRTDFCSRSCYNKHHFKKDILITIKKGDKTKQVKPCNVPAYVKYGWERIDPLINPRIQNTEQPTFCEHCKQQNKNRYSKFCSRECYHNHLRSK